MGRQISLFTDYHQDENRVTNYCGLILKMLHAENPTSFSEVMQSLAECDLIVEPCFEQQRKSEGSVPDLAITQGSFSIFFETKLTNWFHDDQIERHLDGLGQADKNILFLLCNFENDDYAQQFKDQIAIAKNNNIVLAPVSYENLLGAIEAAPKTDQLTHLVEEFRIYLDHKGLFPQWKYMLDVVNAGKTSHEIEQGFYACPNTPGAYSHQRAKYFGPYKDKAVSTIHEIDAIVVVGEDNGTWEIKWNNTQDSEQIILDRAKKHFDEWEEWRIIENREVSMQIFLLGAPFETSFRKDSYGGLYGSKKYFRGIANDVSTAQELAQKLDGENWKRFE